MLTLFRIILRITNINIGINTTSITNTTIHNILLVRKVTTLSEFVWEAGLEIEEKVILFSINASKYLDVYKFPTLSYAVTSILPVSLSNRYFDFISPISSPFNLRVYFAIPENSSSVEKYIIYFPSSLLILVILNGYGLE